MEKTNLKLFYFINDMAGHSRLLDGAAVFLAKYLPFFLILFIAWAWARGGKEYRKIVIGGCVSIGVGIVLNMLISSFLFHPRPFALGIGRMLLAHTPDASFPSRHATFMMSFSLFLCYFRRSRPAGLALLVLSALCGALRVYCGVHFPWDIAGSFLVSFIASLGVFIFAPFAEEDNSAG